MSGHRTLGKYITIFQYVNRKDVYAAYSALSDYSLITGKLLIETAVKEFLTTSVEIDEFIKKVKDETKVYLAEDTGTYNSYIYYSQYGGSKSQLAELVQDELKPKQSKRNMGSEFNNDFGKKIIFVRFNEATDITGSNVFDQLSKSVMRAIARDLESEEEYEELFPKLEQIIYETKVGSEGQRHKNEIIKGIEALKSKYNISNNSTIKGIYNALDNVRFMDNEVIMDKSSEIMKLISDKGFVFFFVFDELDQWFDTDRALLTDVFINSSRILMKIFSLYDEIKVIFLFLATDRVQLLFEDEVTSKPFEKTDPAINRFISIFKKSEKLTEKGYYDDQISEAIKKFIAMKYVISKSENLPNQADLERFSKLFITYFTNSTYKRRPRRSTNGTIREVVESYFKIHGLFTEGLRIIAAKNNQDIGNIIPSKLAEVLKSMNVGNEFKRKEITIPGTRNRLDGEFIVGEKAESINVELKYSTASVRNLRIDQVINAVETYKQKVIFWVFGDFDKKEVKKMIVNKMVEKGLLEYIDFVEVITVRNKIAYAPLIGLANMRINNAEQAKKAFDATAKFLKIFSTVSVDLANIFRQFATENPNPNPSLKQLDGIDKIVFEFLRGLKKKKKGFTMSGKKTKGSIENTFKRDNGILHNLVEIYERLMELEIITTNKGKTIQFTSEITRLGINEELPIEDFEKEISEIISEKLKKED